MLYRQDLQSNAFLLQLYPTFSLPDFNFIDAEVDYTPKNVKIWYFAYKCVPKGRIPWAILIKVGSRKRTLDLLRVRNFTFEHQSPKIVKIWNFWYNFVHKGTIPWAIRMKFGVGEGAS